MIILYLLTIYDYIVKRNNIPAIVTAITITICLSLARHDKLYVDKYPNLQPINNIASVVCLYASQNMITIFCIKIIQGSLFSSSDIILIAILRTNILLYTYI